MGRGFQTVQGRVPSSTERGATGRASKRLERFGLAMLAIADQSVDMSIGDAEVGALLIGTGIAFGVDPLGCAPAAFDLAPGTHRGRHRSYDRWVAAREATGGAIVGAAELEQTMERRALGPSS